MRVLSEKELKAKKEHRCNYCSGKIQKLEIYQKASIVSDGDFYTWKSHLSCTFLAHLLKMFDDADEGVTQDHFVESIRCEYQNLICNTLDGEQDKFPEVVREISKVNFYDMLSYVYRHHKSNEATTKQ
jgi:hypothetical protein